MAFASYGAWGPRTFAALEELVRNLVVVDIDRQPVGEALRRLRRGSRPPETGWGQQNDLWIAATAAATRAVVLTTDR